MKKILDVVLANDEVKHLNFNNISNLLTVYEYLEKKDKELHGYVPRLKIDDLGQASILYVATPEQLKINTRRDSMFIFGEETRDLKASIEDFTIDKPKRKEALRVIKKMLSVIDDEKRNPNKGLYIFTKGVENIQVGKTYLANVIANELADRGKSGVFLFAPSFVRQSKDFQNLEGRISVLSKVDLLVIDDIGAEKTSLWFRTEVLLPVLQKRLSNKLLTIFTSNYSIDELENLYLKSSDEMDCRRIRSRIEELAMPIEME